MEEGEQKIEENCGLCVSHSLHDIYSFLKSLQHRGREAAGLGFIGKERIDVLKWVGRVDRFDLGDIYKIFKIPDYHTFFAHVRYATRGRKDKLLEDAHPHVIGGRAEIRDSHVIIRDCEVIGIHNGQVNPEFLKEISPELLKTQCDTEALLHFYRQNSEVGLIKKIPGSYTLAIADKRRKQVIVMRDRTGIKPGVLGWKDGKYLIASEDSAIRKNGAEFRNDLTPGTIYYLYSDGRKPNEEFVLPLSNKFCFFEYNYVAHVDSIINGVPVRRIRETLGEILAEEFPLKADIVSFLPRCPEVAARKYAEARNIPFFNLFYKPRDERAFQGSTLEDRKQSIKENLYILPETNKEETIDFLKNKDVIIIDDSTIRGNNSKRAVELLKKSGAKKVYLLNYTPKIGIIGEDKIERGCLYGVDMPPDDDFVVRTKEKDKNRTSEEINAEIGAEVYYISPEGMLKGFERLGLPRDNLCYFCIGGKKPF